MTLTPEDKIRLDLKNQEIAEEKLLFETSFKDYEILVNNSFQVKENTLKISEHLPRILPD